MTSIRKTKKIFKSIPTCKDSDKFTSVVVFRGVIRYSLKSALIHLKQINAESAFKRRCVRNPRLRAIYCDPLKYGQNKQKETLYQYANDAKHSDTHTNSFTRR